MLNLEKITDLHYKSNYGYFIFKKKESSWVFIPFEKEFNNNQLMEIMKALDELKN